jgi:hypothetical protein
MLFLLSLYISHCRKILPYATVFLFQLEHPESSRSSDFINVGSLLTEIFLPSKSPKIRN